MAQDKRVRLVDTLSDEDLVLNILAVFEASDLADADWYRAARTFAEGLASVHGLSLEAAAGIVAALSPTCPWDRNMVLAETMSATGDCRHRSGDAIRKARRIRAGEAPLDVLGGRKVRSFYGCILDPENAGLVCVDRHAYDVAVGDVTSDAERKSLESDAGYARIADAYRRAAAKVGLLPQELQAITWCQWRRAH